MIDKKYIRLFCLLFVNSALLICWYNFLSKQSDEPIEILPTEWSF